VKDRFTVAAAAAVAQQQNNDDGGGDDDKDYDEKSKVLKTLRLRNFLSCVAGLL
jgi:hypothetical protein